MGHLLSLATQSSPSGLPAHALPALAASLSGKGLMPNWVQWSLTQQPALFNKAFERLFSEVMLLNLLRWWLVCSGSTAFFDLLSIACACEWLAVCHVCLSHLLLVTACDYCCSSKAGNDRYYMFVVISATVFHGRLTYHKKYSGQISMPYLSLNLPQHSNMTGCLVLHLLMIQLKQSHCYDTGDEAGARGARTTQAAR